MRTSHASPLCTCFLGYLHASFRFRSRRDAPRLLEESHHLSRGHLGTLSGSPPPSHLRWSGRGDPLRVAYRIIAGWSGTIPEGSCTPFIWALILTIFARWALTCHRFGGAHSMTYLMQLYPKRAYPDSTLDQRHDQGRLAFWSLFGFCSGNGDIRPGQGPPVCCTCLGPFLIYCVRLPCHWLCYHRARSS